MARDTFSAVRRDETTFCKEMPDGTFPGPMHAKETLARRETPLFQNCSYLCRHFLVSLAKRYLKRGVDGAGEAVPLRPSFPGQTF